MSHLVSVSHIDTCLACFVQDHHNRPGEMLLGVDVYRSTRVHEVRSALIDAYRCDSREDGPAFDHVCDAIAGCFKGAHPLKVFDGTLDHNLADSEGEACQAWFLITWPVAEEPAPAPLASAEQQATPVQQQQANAAMIGPALAGDIVMAPGPAHLYPAAAHAVRRAYNGQRNFMTPNLVGYQVAGPWAIEVSWGEGFRERDGRDGPRLYAVTVVSLETYRPDFALSSVVIDREAAGVYIGRLNDLGNYRRRRHTLMLRLARPLNSSLEREEYRLQLCALRYTYARTLERFGCELPDATARQRQPGELTIGEVVHAADVRRPAEPDYSACTQATPVQQQQGNAGASDLYILMIDCSPCPLKLEPCTIAEARRAITWQERGTALASEFAITRYDAVTRRFVCIDTGRVYRVTEPGCYTQKAFARFLASLPIASSVTFEAWQAARYAVPSLADCPALALHFDGMAFADGSDLGGWVYPLGSVEGAAMYVEACPGGYRFDACGGMAKAQTVEAIERLLWVHWACDAIGDRLSPLALERLSVERSAFTVNSAPRWAL